MKIDTTTPINGTTGATLAFLGHEVTCVDIDEAKLDKLRAIGTSEIPETHRPFVIEQAGRYFDRPRRSVRRRSGHYDMAILVNPDEPNAPSDDAALRRFARAARKLGIDAELMFP